MIAVGSEIGEVVVFDQAQGTRTVLPLEGRLHGVSLIDVGIIDDKQAAKEFMAFSPILPTTLIIPVKDHLLVVQLPSLGTREVFPFPRQGRDIAGLAMGPVVDGKGGLCAVIREGGRDVALLGMDNFDG